MKKISFSAVILLIAALLYTGCSDSDIVNTGSNTTTTLNVKKIDSAYAIGSKSIVAFYAADSLRTGYNKIYLVLYDSATGSRINSAHVSLMPMMDMGGGMQHSAPYENPAGEVPVNGYYQGAVVFIMPSDMMMPWKLTVMVHNHSAPGEPEGEAEFGSLVVVNNPTKFKSVLASDSSRLYLSYVQPQVPVVGMNDFEFTLHKKISMMSYPADSSYTSRIYPWMPSMGHGSPNNVDPVHSTAGHYKGRVNFTMTGDWQVKVFLTKNGVTDSTYFDLIF